MRALADDGHPRAAALREKATAFDKDVDAFRAYPKRLNAQAMSERHVAALDFLAVAESEKPPSK